MKWNYIDENRIGDHICYYSDLTKMKKHYPNWDVTKSLHNIFQEIYQAWMTKKQ
jgi:CDP-paratose 2-epimerase